MATGAEDIQRMSPLFAWIAVVGVQQHKCYRKTTNISQNKRKSLSASDRLRNFIISGCLVVHRMGRTEALGQMARGGVGVERQCREYHRG